MNDPKILFIEKASWFTLSDRVNLLLVYLREKPAAQLNSYPPSTKKGWKLEESVQSDSLFETLSLHTQSIDKTRVDHAIEQGIVTQHILNYKLVFTASESDILSRLVEAYKNHNEELMGLYFGYPQTAIDAFLKKRTRNPHIIHDGNPLCFFSYWVQSAEFFHKEIASTAQRWHDAVQKTSPSLYEEIQSDERKVAERLALRKGK